MQICFLVLIVIFFKRVSLHYQSACGVDKSALLIALLTNQCAKLIYDVKLHEEGKEINLKMAVGCCGRNSVSIDCRFEYISNIIKRKIVAIVRLWIDIKS